MGFFRNEPMMVVASIREIDPDSKYGKGVPLPQIPGIKVAFKGIREPHPDKTQYPDLGMRKTGKPPVTTVSTVNYPKLHRMFKPGCMSIDMSLPAEMLFEESFRQFWFLPAAVPVPFTMEVVHEGMFGVPDYIVNLCNPMGVTVADVIYATHAKLHEVIEMDKGKPVRWIDTLGGKHHFVGMEVTDAGLWLLLES